MKPLPTPDGLLPDIADYRLLHLSDTHFTSRGVLYNQKIDPQAALGRAVAEIRRGIDNGHAFDAIVVSGDLTDSGDPDAYRRLRADLEALQIPMVWCTGNHDDRLTYHQEILDEKDSNGAVRVQFHWVGVDAGLRLIVLDSTVANGGHGYLPPNLPEMLGPMLDTPAPGGTIVVLHHSPLPPPSPLLTYFALDRRSRRTLSDTIAGTDVRLVLSGHHHLAQSGVLGSVPVVVAGSTAIRTDPLARPGHERTTASASMNLLTLYPETFTNSVIPLDDAEEIFDLDESACAAIVGNHPIDVRDSHPAWKSHRH